MTTINIPLSYEFMSHTMNRRYKHWSQKARVVKAIREQAYWLGKHARVDKLQGHPHIHLLIEPKTRRRRDAENYVPILKAAVDGLVDAGLAPDDTQQHMTKHMPTICDPGKGSIIIQITTKEPQ